MRAIRQYEFGGPDVLRLETLDDPVPGVGEVAIEVHAAGVHLLDTSIRAGTGFGSLPRPDLPMVPGREVAGVVDAIGPDADDRWLGQRVVVHLGAASGGYASRAAAPADALFALPDNVDFAEAVAMVGTGRTALAILDVAAPRADDVLLVTAAAGGIGSLLVQAGRNAGALVVGAAGGRAKTEIVDRLGADVSVDYDDAAWPDRVREALGDKRITLALDGVGGALGRTAFELVAPGGRMVLFGYSSGAVMPLDAADLFATGVTVSAAIGARIAAKPGGIRAYAQEALDALAAGTLHPLVHPPFALADAAAAHRALESRATTGKVVFVP
jgi:NADPH2:quinone reductase